MIQLILESNFLLSCDEPLDTADSATCIQFFSMHKLQESHDDNVFT